jgi:16S rRNA processing protein RimM
MTVPSESAPAEWVGLARIRRPQGRKGEVFADILTDFPEKFASRRHLWLMAAKDQSGKVKTLRQGEARKVGDLGPSHLGTRDTESPIPPPRQVELLHHWLHKAGIILHFAGVDSISAAEALKGLTVAIPIAERAPLGEDEAYIADLIGCTLIDVARPAPIDVGIIHDVDLTAGPAPLLIVRGSRGEVLVPFAKQYLRKIDLAAKRIEMALPEGLVDLNAANES